MSDPNCVVLDSGWLPGRDTQMNSFEAGGVLLVAKLRRWSAGDTDERPFQHLPEEMGAVLDGVFELVCGDERYVLEAGDGILIPAHEARTWRLLSDHGAVYRVGLKKAPAP